MWMPFTDLPSVVLDSSVTTANIGLILKSRTPPIMNSQFRWWRVISFSQTCFSSDGLPSTTAAKKVTMDDFTCSGLMTACEQAGLWPNALRISASPVIFASALCLCQRVDRWKDALEMMTWMSLWRVKTNCLVYSAGITTLATSAWRHGLILWTLALADTTVDLILRSTAINALQQGQHWRGGLELLSDITREGPNLVATSAVMSMMQNWRQALLFYAELLTFRLANVVATTAVVTAALNPPRVQLPQLLAVLQSMGSQSLVPSSGKRMSPAASSDHGVASAQSWQSLKLIFLTMQSLFQ